MPAPPRPPTSPTSPTSPASPAPAPLPVAALSTFSCEDHQGVTVAEVACSSVREHQAAVMRDQLRLLAGRNGGRLVIGLEAVSDLSASFLCDLMWLRERCERLGGRLVLFGASDGIAARLESFGLCAGRGRGGRPALALVSTRTEAVATCLVGQAGSMGSPSTQHAPLPRRALSWLRGGRAA